MCLERCVVRRDMERIRMKDLPTEQRPYEKCRKNGPETLSDGELLSVIIRTGSRDDAPRAGVTLADGMDNVARSVLITICRNSKVGYKIQASLKYEWPA